MNLSNHYLFLIRRRLNCPSKFTLKNNTAHSPWKQSKIDCLCQQREADTLAALLTYNHNCVSNYFFALWTWLRLVAIYIAFVYNILETTRLAFDLLEITTIPVSLAFGAILFTLSSTKATYVTQHNQKALPSAQLLVTMQFVAKSSYCTVSYYIIS